MIPRLLLLIPLLIPACAIAHPARVMSASLSVAPDGQFVVRLHFDLLAYLLNDSPQRVDHESMDALLDGPTGVLVKHLEQAQARMLRGVSVICDGRTIRADRIEFPTTSDVEKWKAAGTSHRLPVMQDATLYGQIPKDTKTVAIKLPEVLGQTIFTIDRPGEESYSEPVDAGHVSTSLPSRLTQPQSPVKPDRSTNLIIVMALIATAWIVQRLMDWRSK